MILLNKYPSVTMYRTMRSDQGTRGQLFSNNGFACHSLELPWRNNQRNISCIPPGEYLTEIRLSQKFGKVYHLKDVPDRTYILIHSGNWAGDISKGFNTHVNGCILLGQKSGILANQWAVLNSRVNIRRFMDHMDDKPFVLRILEYFGG